MPPLGSCLRRARTRTSLRTPMEMVNDKRNHLPGGLRVAKPRAVLPPGADIPSGPKWRWSTTSETICQIDCPRAFERWFCLRETTSDVALEKRPALLGQEGNIRAGRATWAPRHIQQWFRLCEIISDPFGRDPPGGDGRSRSRVRPALAGA
jgi:hypothetical protein